MLKHIRRRRVVRHLAPVCGIYVLSFYQFLPYHLSFRDSPKNTDNQTEFLIHSPIFKDSIQSFNFEFAQSRTLGVFALDFSLAKNPIHLASSASSFFLAAAATSVLFTIELFKCVLYKRLYPSVCPFVRSYIRLSVCL